MAPTIPIYLEPGGAKQVIGSGGTQEVQSGGVVDALSGAQVRIRSGAELQLDAGADINGAQISYRARSQIFNIDNGAGTTIDDVIMKINKNLTLTKARIVYVTETTGTVAAGNAKLGSTLAAADIVAATAYEDTKAVGVETAMTILSAGMNKGDALFCRHTGVVATPIAGQAYVEIEYTIDADQT